MEKEFVPYELAVKLKELGFDEPCLFAFDNCSTPMRCSNLRTNDQKFNGVNYNSSTYTSQPTFSQSFRWFREKYNIPCKIEASQEDLKVNAYHYFYQIQTGSHIVGFGIQHNLTYEEAELACLTKLIEILETRTK